jgi:CxxC motif-containing protein
VEAIQEIICITCPKGCDAKIWEEKGSIKMKGKVCKKGRAYIQQEFLEPKRVLTSTVVVAHSRTRRLPVRTADAIPKKDLFRAMDQLSKVRVKPPVHVGEVIISNLLDTGVDLIASDDVLA